MAAIVACLAVTTVFLGCSKDDKEPDPLTYDEGVMINGVTWATRNVNNPNTFASSPEDAGMFYQWNSKVGWSSTDPLTSIPNGNTWITPWDGNGAVAWETANNVCPEGWRLPTKAELESLGEGEWTTTPADGLIFGSGDNTIFLPVAGRRNPVTNELHNVGVYGYYWSSEPISGTMSYNLVFGESYFSVNDEFRKACGFCIRCVKDSE